MLYFYYPSWKSLVNRQYLHDNVKRIKLEKKSTLVFHFIFRLSSYKKFLSVVPKYSSSAVFKVCPGDP